MTTVLVGVGVAALAFASGVAGLFLQKPLPEPHSVERSRDMIGAIVGLVSLLLALVLGTLVGSSYAFYWTQKSIFDRPTRSPIRRGLPVSPW